MAHKLTPARPADGSPAHRRLLEQSQGLLDADAARAAATRSQPERVARLRIKASNLIEGLRGAIFDAALMEAAAVIDASPAGARTDALCGAHAVLARHGVVEGDPSERLRECDVVINGHVGPKAAHVPALMTAWEGLYSRQPSSPAAALLDAVCAHHRLLYIHPFRDGNGRLARLDLEARLHAAGLHCRSHWAPSAALWRAESAYRAALSIADGARRGDLDGRGALSQDGLNVYCEAMLSALIEEVRRR